LEERSFPFFYDWPSIHSVDVYVKLYERGRYILSKQLDCSRKNLNSCVRFLVMNTIDNTDMPGAETSVWPFFLFVATTFGGYTCMELFYKWNETNDTVGNIKKEIEDLKLVQDAQQDTLDEHSERLREKKDYDETSEVEEGKFQAWRGEASQETLRMKITIWRVKVSSIQKNQEWMAWDGSADSSCIVRDFYLGNGNPDFVWKESENHVEVDETLINGWDSVIRISIVVDRDPESNPLDYNRLLKKYVNEGVIQWSRVLIPS
jgi:hypothetical protein